jgi:hypothetical protein
LDNFAEKMRKVEREKREKEEGKKEKNFSPDNSPSENFSAPSEKKSPSPLLPFSLSLLHLAVAVPLAFLLNVWMDEASALYTTGRGLRETFQNVFADEKQAPLYFLLLSVWREASDSVFWARLFSIFCSLLSIKFFIDLARRFYDENQARFISILFALHPFLIWASVEARVYSLTILISILLIKFFVEGFFDSESVEAERLIKQRFFFIPTAIIALYTNYYLGFLLVGFFAALLVLRKFREASRYFLQMLFVLLAISPLLWIVRQQLAVNTSGFQPEQSLLEGLRVLWNNALTLIFPTELNPPPVQTWVSFFRLWAVRFGILIVGFLLAKKLFQIVKTVRGNRRRTDGKVEFLLTDFDDKVLIFAVIAATVAMFLLAAYFLLSLEYVALRHMAVWFVPLGLFVFSLLAMVLPRRSWIFFAAVFAFLYPYAVYTTYPKMAKRGDWIRVARYIEAHEKPNQPIIVFQNYDALSLPHHYRGVNRILPDEKFFAWNLEGAPGTEDAYRKQTEFVISEIPPEAEEIWLATEETCQREEIKAACKPLENFVEANYTIEQEKDFYLERVRLLRKKPR